MAPSRSVSQGKTSRSFVGTAAFTISHQSRVISGFHILPLSIPSCPSVHHYLYLRPHDDKTASAPSSSSSKAALPADRTLFLVNLPVDATERHLRHLFEKAGRVQEVRFRRRIPGPIDGQQAGEDLEEGGSDNEEDNDLEASATAVASGNAQQEVDVIDKRAKYRKAKKPSGPQAPAFHSLPSLDPRRDSSFLQTGSSAHVIFLESASVQRALDMASASASSEKKARKWVDPQVSLLRSLHREIDEDEAAGSGSGGKLSRPSTAREAKLASVSQNPPAPTGLAYFLQSYATHRPDLAEVKRHADSVVKRYTFFRSHPQLDPDRQHEGGELGSRVGQGGIKIASYGPAGEPLDEDGFTIVLPGGKYGKSLGASGDPLDPSALSTSVRFARQSQMDHLALAAKARKEQEASAGLEDFYRFQNRERRKEKLADMRRKFEDDRAKVEEMKRKGGGAAGRRFKPY